MFRNRMFRKHNLVILATAALLCAAGCSDDDTNPPVNKDTGIDGATGPDRGTPDAGVAGEAGTTGDSAVPDAVAPDMAAPPAKPYFKGPSGITATPTYVVVANSNSEYKGGAMQYNPTWVTVIDRATRQVVGKVSTTQVNTQYVAAHGEKIYAVNTGGISYDKNFLASPSTAGGVDVIDLTSGVPGAVAANMKLSPGTTDTRVGAPGAIFVTSDGKRALVGSGTRADVFALDLTANKVVRGTENPIALWTTPAGKNGLTIVRAWDSKGVAVANFNTDELCTSTDLANDLANRSCGVVGVQGSLAEGPIDVARAPDGQALVLMSLANALYKVDLTKTPFGVNSKYAATGQANNRLRVHKGAAYIVNSMSDNVQKVDLTSGTSTLPLATVPKKSNPYDMVITTEKEGEVAWVTLLMTHKVAVINLGTGKVITTID